MSGERKERPSCEIFVFPHSRLVGIARRLIDLSEVKSAAEMAGIWRQQMDDLEAQMIRCGAGFEERALQLYLLFRLTESEKFRRVYEGRRREPDEAA